MMPTRRRNRFWRLVEGLAPMTRLRLTRPAGSSAVLPEGVTGTDVSMMRRAIELAREAAAEGEVPVGAVVYQGERIIAEGANNREATQDPVGHAELLAMSLAGQSMSEWRLTDCSLAVTLEPCPMCAGAMVNARLGRVIYGARDPKAGACDTLYHIPTDRRLNHEVTVIGGVLADECGELLKSFFRARRKTNRTRQAG